MISAANIEKRMETHAYKSPFPPTRKHLTSFLIQMQNISRPSPFDMEAQNKYNVNENG